MRLMPFCIFVALASFPLSASAQEPEADTGTTRPREETSPPVRHVTVFTGGDFAMGNIHDVNVLRTFGTLGVTP